MPCQYIYDKDTIEDSADEFQLHRMWMVIGRRGKGHLFLIFFEQFLVAHFFILHVISVNYTSFIAGRNVPEGKRLGHAGAIVEGTRGTAESKMKALTEAGVKVADVPWDLGPLMKEMI